MIGLRELFEEGADMPGPPTSMIADEIYIAGRRLHRRRRAAAAGAAALVLAVALGVTGLIALRPGVRSVPGDPATRSPRSATAVHPGEYLQYAAAFDATHLYAVFPDCRRSPCSKTEMQLVGSDDGGRTWTDRGDPIDVHGLLVVKVLAARTLVVNIVRGHPNEKTFSMVSTDGGRTWAETVPKQVMGTVSEEGAVVCASGGEGGSCALYVADAGSRFTWRLPAAPPLVVVADLLDASGIQQVAGRIWITGRDPKLRLPAVAVSGDAGRTWKTHVFDELAGCSRNRCSLQLHTAADGATAYLVASREQQPTAVYRGTDRGAWTAQNTRGVEPSRGLAGGSFVAADGSLVLAEAIAEVDHEMRMRFWAPRGEGGSYVPVELNGLPDSVYAIRRATNGWYFTFTQRGNVLYGSTDGWNWSRLAER